ncbi:MAG TPA: hypothetical protein VMV61_11790 [Patescibacteria group bacterium]|nr:hypothetical protein [Patescibacteria group bacterium]
MQRIRIAIVVSVAAALVLLCWFYLSRPRRDAKAVAVAETQVYEAVVRDMFRTAHGQSQVKQLVFDKAVVAGLDVVSRPVPASCKENVLSSPRLHRDNPPFNSLADKTYRLIIRGGDDYSLRADTIQNFAERACTGGSVSQAFRTDLPRTFIADDSVYFEGWPTRNKNAESFERLFPGAPGIISFSHVGFDASLDQAIVSTSFVCGGLCGTGKIYILKKRWGRWRVVNQWIVWVS